MATQQQQLLAAARHVGRGAVYVAAHLWIRLSCVACVCFTVVVLFSDTICHRIIRTKTDGPNTMSGATGFRKQPHSSSAQSTNRSTVHSRSRIQQQPAALRQLLWFVAVRVIACVLYVCKQKEYTAVLMYGMHRLG